MACFHIEGVTCPNCATYTPLPVEELTPEKLQELHKEGLAARRELEKRFDKMRRGGNHWHCQEEIDELRCKLKAEEQRVRRVADAADELSLVCDLIWNELDKLDDQGECWGEPHKHRERLWNALEKWIEAKR